MPTGKHYTTPTVLSSGEALKKTNFVGVLSSFAPLPAGQVQGGVTLSQEEPDGALTDVKIPPMSLVVDHQSAITFLRDEMVGDIVQAPVQLGGKAVDALQVG